MASAQTPQQVAYSAAAEYASLGWAPISLRNKVPTAKGWTGSTPDTWRDLWKEGATSVGICTGSNSGFVVVDIDIKDGGLRCWEALVAEHGDPQTVKVATGGGGYHYYFALDERTATLTKGIKRIRDADGMPSGIDLMAEGSQVVAPPSVHYSGRKYRFVVRPERYPEGPAPMPEWLFQLLRASEK